VTKQSKKERQMFDGFYKGKSILVTGHTGFKGSWDDLTDPQVLHEAKLLKLNCDKAHCRTQLVQRPHNRRLLANDSDMV